MPDEATTDAESGKKRVFIIDDHPLVREWLATLINQQPDLRVCGEAASASEALKLIGTAKPQAAIVDISLEGGSGLDLIKEIKASCPVIPEIVILVLTMHDEALYCERALRAGARGYIMKRDATRNVLQAIRSVLKGEIYLTDRMAKLMAEKFVEGKKATGHSQVEGLSDRELEVFLLLGRGMVTKQIAEELHVSFKTIQSFKARIKEKLHISSANELLREAVRWHDRASVK